MRDAYEQVENDYKKQVMEYLDRIHARNLAQDKINDIRIDQITRNGNSGCQYESTEYYPPRGNSYYDVGGIEVIDYIKAKLTPEQYKGYLLGNVYKYSGRMQYKGTEQQDTKKLVDYVTWLKDHNESNV